MRPDLLERLGMHELPDGLFVLSWPGSEPVREFAGLNRSEP